MTTTKVILAKCGYGAQIFDTKNGPEAIANQLNLVDYITIDENPLPNNPSITQRAQAVESFCSRLGNSCKKYISDNKLLIIGGDHSIALGTWSGVTEGLNAKGDFGLIWIDAHLDSHTFESSPSKALHGMPVAALLGQGENTFKNAVSDGPHIGAKHLCFIGARSFEEQEIELLNRLGVKIFYIEDVAKNGLAATLEEAIAIASGAKHGFGISIDLDVIDPSFAPGVGSPEQNGLLPDELIKAIAPHLDNPKLKALEIVELNPKRDINSQTCKIAANLCDIFIKNTAIKR